ncbi:MAG: transporter associated domain-containing protein [Tissierellia bacterium]|nr:transporter associated domain-containing protein [Tissierellia bacterium]
MNQKRNLLVINRLIYILEMVLSAILIVGIIISIPDLGRYFLSILQSDKALSYELLQEFLSHVMLLVIGLEFVMMMVAHSESSVVYLLVMMIARKILIYAHDTVDLLIGVLAMLLVFVIRRFLMNNTISQPAQSGMFSAATEISVINERFKYNIDGLGFTTIGGLVFYLLDHQGMEVKVEAIVDDGDHIYQIVEANNGIIETIAIQKK